MNEGPHVGWLMPTPRRAQAFRRADLGRCGAWAVLVLSLVGCGDASLKNVRFGQLAQPMERVFVLVHAGTIDESCAVEMTKALLTALSGHTSARKGTVLTGRELSEKPLLDLVKKFGADGLLVLKPIGGTLTFFEGVAEVIYAAELVELRSDRVVWQATVTHNGGTAAVGKRSRIAAEKIVQSMVLAHVLREAGS